MLENDRWPALFPERPSASPEDLSRRLSRLHVTHSSDPHYHFRLAAPTGWRWRPLEEAGSPPGLLASIVSDTSPAAEIRVFADEVPREVHPASFALHRLERAGETLWARRQTSTPIGTMADLLTRNPSPSPTVTRANMAKDGKRIFTLTAAAPEPDYPLWAHDFTAVLASFHLLSPERAPLAEPLASYCYLYPAVVGFSYPASFTLAENTLGPTTCDARFEATENTPTAGTLHLLARPDTRPRKLAADFLASLPHDSPSPPDTFELHPTPPPTGFDEAWTTTTTSTFATHPRETHTLIVTTSKATLLLARSGRPHTTSPFEAMVLDRAFDIARATLYAV